MGTHTEERPCEDAEDHGPGAEGRLDQGWACRRAWRRVSLPQEWLPYSPRCHPHSPQHRSQQGVSFFKSKCIGVTLVNGIMQVSSVHFYDA